MGNCHRDFRNLAAILVISMVLSFHCGSTSRVTLVDNGYRDVLVAISPAANRNGIVEGLQSLLKSTSAALFEATGNRTYFSTIQILSPNVKNLVYKKPGSRKRRDSWAGVYPSFDNADIRVDVANTAYGNYPYTQQARGCGEPGEFIHLTPDFVLSPSETHTFPQRLIANEWIKYRYGVFDENGYYDSNRYPQKYYSDQSDSLTDNVCSNTGVTWSNNQCKVEKSSTGVPADCTLTTDKNSNYNLKSSMMSLPLTSLATQYCNESNHNEEAPNKQNILCGGKSIMEVILNHADFANGANQPININQQVSFLPTVYPGSGLALVILWDPMAFAETVNSARPSIMKFISKDLPNDAYFGMIETINNDSAPLVPLVKLSNDRSVIVAKIKTMQFLPVTGNRSISEILKTALTMLNGATVQNKAVIIMSNSASKSDLSTSCATANSTGSNVQLHFITYSAGAAQNFLEIEGCPGNAYLIQGNVPSSSSTETKNCYRDLQNRAILDNVFMNFPSMIAPDTFTKPLIFQEMLYSDTVVNGTFLIDVPTETVDVYFYIEGCSMNGVDVQVLIPSRWLGTKSHIVPYDENTVAFFEPTTLSKNGTWQFGVTPQVSNEPVPYVVYAVGRSKLITADVSLSIQAKAWTVVDTGKNSNGMSFSRVRIFTSVTRGTSPVFNAKVEAKIFTDSGTATTITLYDDASGNPDTTAQDGIYSAYFTQFLTTNKPYSIIVNVTDNGTATYPTSQYTWISQNDMRTHPTGYFQRTAQPSAFLVGSNSGAINIPPGAIADFRVQSIQGTVVTFQWTAPGGDLDYGLTVSQYLIRCSTERSTLNGSNLNNIPEDPSIIPPQPDIPKTVQTFSITGALDGQTHFCAIQAVDNVNNYGLVSPICSYYILGSSGMSTAAIAGIVVGVILGLLLFIGLVVLIWWCCAKDDKPKKTDPTDPRFKVISISGAANQNGSKPDLTEDPMTIMPLMKTYSEASGSRYGGRDDGSDDDGGSHYPASEFNGNRSQTPRIPLPPQIPLDTFHDDEKALGTSPDGNDYDGSFMMQQADIAIPERLDLKIAVIEDVGEYSNAKMDTEKPTSPNANVQPYNNPSYSNLLSNNPMPSARIRGPNSVSSSTYSLNSTGRQTPGPHNSRV